jgi:glycosyltransferase involved in cell wall biosynthesis
VQHLHVHFARRAALDALRVGRLVGVPYSVTAHAWDIFKEPLNLVEKLERSAFVTTGCDYNVRHLRQVAGAESADKIHEIVMGVDTEWFSRTASYDGNGKVVAVGRLVEKKGFAYLLDAAARLRDFDGLRELVIVGDGELREELEERGRSLGVDGLVRFAGSKRPEDVRALLEQAAVLAMPAVVAADGDRDSMPVVVKEALAMGVPVVATDEVGLPEVVRDDWGRLVPPADAEALAEAIRELLELPPAERAKMGERGREFILREYTVSFQTRRLIDLIEGA